MGTGSDSPQTSRGHFKKRILKGLKTCTLPCHRRGSGLCSFRPHPSGMSCLNPSVPSLPGCISRRTRRYDPAAGDTPLTPPRTPYSGILTEENSRGNWRFALQPFQPAPQTLCRRNSLTPRPPRSSRRSPSVIADAPAPHPRGDARAEAALCSPRRPGVRRADDGRGGHDGERGGALDSREGEAPRRRSQRPVQPSTN